MKNKPVHFHPRFPLLIVLMLLFGAAGSPAALLEVEQVIWGMDCAPCAYGMQRGLEKLPGVEKVTVSLNRGNATLMLARGNKLSLSAIRRVVNEGGFTSKEATVLVEGTLHAGGGHLRLRTEGADYALTPPAADPVAWNKLRQTETGAKLTIRGRLPADSANEITVEDVAP